MVDVRGGKVGFKGIRHILGARMGRHKRAKQQGEDMGKYLSAKENLHWLMLCENLKMLWRYCYFCEGGKSVGFKGLDDVLWAELQVIVSLEFWRLHFIVMIDIHHCRIACFCALRSFRKENKASFTRFHSHFTTRYHGYFFGVARGKAARCYFSVMISCLSFKKSRSKESFMFYDSMTFFVYIICCCKILWKEEFFFSYIKLIECEIFFFFFRINF